MVDKPQHMHIIWKLHILLKESKSKPHTHAIKLPSSAKLGIKTDSPNNFINTFFCTYNYIKV